MKTVINLICLARRKSAPLPPAGDSERTCHCNYSNNYYGDQICTPR